MGSERSSGWNPASLWTTGWAIAGWWAGAPQACIFPDWRHESHPRPSTGLQVGLPPRRVGLGPLKGCGRGDPAPAPGSEEQHPCLTDVIPRGPGVGAGASPGSDPSPSTPQTVGAAPYSGDLERQKGSPRELLIHKGSSVCSVCKLSWQVPRPGGSRNQAGDQVLCGWRQVLAMCSPEGTGVISSLGRPCRRPQPGRLGQQSHSLSVWRPEI